MQFHEFIGQVQQQLELPDEGRALKATRVVLTTLGERLQPGEATDLAGPLPMEIDRFLETADSGQQFDYGEFVDRVADRGGVDRADAVYWAQVVVAITAENVPPGEFDDVRTQLPEDYVDLFELVDAGIDIAG